MDYEVEREPAQWHIREKGQASRGITVTDGWLQSMGFGRPSRLNIQAIVNAVYASQGGVTLDEYAANRIPKDIDITPGFKSYPDHRLRGRVPHNPANPGKVVRAPNGLLIRK
jgi:hypothetical protein